MENPVADAMPAYKKLKSGSGGIFQRSPLWLGADHLLVVQGSPFGESYRRFYFHDIQGVVIRRTAGRLLTFVVFSLLALSIAILVAAVDNDLMAGSAVGAGVAMAGVLLVNALRGPSCHCHLRTSVQFERIECIGRVAAARRFVEQIRPTIEAAQGAHVAEQVAAGGDSMRGEVAAPSWGAAS